MACWRALRDLSLLSSRFLTRNLSALIAIVCFKCFSCQQPTSQIERLRILRAGVRQSHSVTRPIRPLQSIVAFLLGYMTPESGWRSFGILLNPISTIPTGEQKHVGLAAPLGRRCHPCMPTMQIEEAEEPYSFPDTVEVPTSPMGGPIPGMLQVDADVWAVPEALRLPSSTACTQADYGRHVSLEELFPGTGLADAWDTNSELRTAMRHALRDDLMEPLLRRNNFSEKQIAARLSMRSAVMLSWNMALQASYMGKINMDTFTEAFRKAGVTGVDGETFVKKIGALCGPTPHGSLIEIIPLDRMVPHSWHQDTGVPQNTALLGFPPHDGYSGGGVFSSFVQLSHPLRPSTGDVHGKVVQFAELSNPPPQIADEYVLRPMYSKGREIWVSNDATHVHSTPDRQFRECLWRFM